MVKNMELEYIRKNISFIKEEHEISFMTGGYSGAITVNINDSYFLKIVDYREGLIKRVKEILEIYAKLNIKTVELVEAGILEKDRKCYFIYKFIKGESVSKLTKSKDIEFFYDTGIEIGNLVYKLKNYNKNTEYIVEGINIIEDAKKIVENIMKIYDKESFLREYFSKQEVSQINKKLLEYMESFRGLPKVLIHNDIKMGNIMLSDKKLIIIDIEEMQYNYYIQNIQCALASMYDNAKKYQYRAFYKGVLKSMFKGEFTNDMSNQIIAMMIWRMYVEIEKGYKNNDNDKMLTYIKRLRDAYDELDGFNKEIYYLK